jgi:hypothetical protein
MKTIKSVGVMSVAKITAAIQAVFGLLFAPIFLLFGALGSLAGQHVNPFGAIGGLALAIMMPIFYGVIGFIMGAIGAWLYNLLAKWIGGIEFEIELAPGYSASAPRI